MTIKQHIMAAMSTTHTREDESEISKIIDASDDNPDTTGYVVVIVVAGTVHEDVGSRKAG